MIICSLFCKNAVIEIIYNYVETLELSVIHWLKFFFAGDLEDTTYTRWKSVFYNPQCLQEKNGNTFSQAMQCMSGPILLFNKWYISCQVKFKPHPDIAYSLDMFIAKTFRGHLGVTKIETEFFQNMLLLKTILNRKIWPQSGKRYLSKASLYIAKFGCFEWLLFSLIVGIIERRKL